MMPSANQSFDAGHANAQSQEKADQNAEFANQSARAAQNTASAAMNKASDAADSSGGQAQKHMEEAIDLLQQTTEQVKNMAQGAVDSVKHSLGMDKQNK